MKSLGFVFPGQGSQYVGMLKDIAEVYPDIQKTFSESSEILGYDLWQLVEQGPADLLDQTIYTQPALLTASYALWRVIQHKINLQSALLAGHSLGEYTALLCANALTFADAVWLVAARGQFMQDAVPLGQGALAAIIGLDDATVTSICQQSMLAGEVLTPANFNSPGQIVIAGDKPAVLRALILAKESGARLAKLLPVSTPSHCSLMQPAALKLKALLATLEIRTPDIPVVNNVDVTLYKTPDEIRDGLTRQLYSPVRWVETIQYFVEQGITNIIECGPGKVLSGLSKRIDANLVLTQTTDLVSLQTLFETSLPME